MARDQWSIRRRKEIRSFVRWLSQRVECVVCGMKFVDHPELCEFHHIVGKKAFTIGDASRYTTSWDRLLREIGGKCVPICLLDHRLLTNKKIRLPRKSFGMRKVRGMWREWEGWYEDCKGKGA